MKEVHRKKLEGIIVSHKTQKTAIVRVGRYFKHAIYRKYIKRSKRYKAHDETHAYQEGDKVVIQETRPISRDKRWVIIAKI